MAIQNVVDDAKSVVDLLFGKKKTSQGESESGEGSDKVNVMIAGKTGVGKSTLINAIFGEALAKTGIGRPVTQNLDLYEKAGLPLRVYDIKGFELDPVVQKGIREELKKLVKASLKTEDKNDDIHLMWYCVASAGVRIEQFELDFIKDMGAHLDVVLVITKSYDADETRNLMSYIEGEKDRGALPIKAIVPVLATDRTIDGVVVKKAFGLKELADLSYELLPDAQKRAFAASQQVSIELRNKAAITAIAFASVAAGAAGAIPIPVADAAVLVPIQLTMLKGIANAYGIKFTENDFTKVVAILVPGAATAAGKAAVTSLLKLIPGVGVAVSVVSGTVAAGLTVALGTAFQKALEHGLSDMDVNDVLSDDFVQIMKDTFEGKLNEIHVRNATN